MTAPATTDAHARLMDGVYRNQRHIYDLTRKYYLFGRDRMLRGLALPGDGRGAAVLEIGCGTGRNLALVGRRWPGAALYGIDISEEMLKSARARLGDGAVLTVGDATGFDADRLLHRPDFDRIVMPYCLSMIPAWAMAIDHACSLLARGGSLHIVDFGDMAGLPAPLRRGLLAWLRKFHVTPRAELPAQVLRLAGAHGLASQVTQGAGGYYQSVTLTRPA